MLSVCPQEQIQKINYRSYTVSWRHKVVGLLPGLPFVGVGIRGRQSASLSTKINDTMVSDLDSICPGSQRSTAVAGPAGGSTRWRSTERNLPADCPDLPEE